MTKDTYNARIHAAAKNLIMRHFNGEKITYTTAWNEVFFNVFNHSNFAKVDGVHRYMPEAIAAIKHAVHQYAL